MKIPAIVLSGGKTTPEFAAEAGVAPEPGARGLAEIDGLPMVRYVLRALQAAERIGPVILVAPTGFPAQPEADLQVAADGNLPQNIAAGLARCPGAPHVLLATADIPFLAPGSVDAYAAACLEAGVDLCYAAIPRSACDAQFPGMRRTWLHTPEGDLTGGNVVVARPEAFPRITAFLDEAYRRRKSPFFLVRLIGLGNVVKFLTGRLTPKDISQGATRALGITCRLLVTPHADLGTDIDRPIDLRQARERLTP